MPKRRANHEGSFYRRASDGRYVATFQGRTRTHKVEAKARQLWAEMKSAALSGYDHRAATTGLHTVEALTARLISPSQAISTQVKYRAALEYLLPYTGSRPIKNVLAADVSRWLELLARKHGHDKARIRQVAYDLLARACKLAIRDGLLLKSPCDNQSRPQARRKPMNPPSVAEAQAILFATVDDRHHVAIALGLLAGLRPCEIFGLRWSRVDWRRKVILVDQAAVEAGKVTLQDHSKTKAGHREVPMIPQLVKALKSRQQQAATEGLEDCELVIPTRVGTPTMRTTFLRRVWHKHLAALGLPQRTFYQSRHSCATLLAGSGVPLQVIAKILGHADSKTTLAMYCHVLGGEALQAMQGLSDLYDTDH